MRIEFQPAYVLHSRPYRETSLLLDLLTPDYGRLGAVAKGVRGARSRRRPLLNPFIPLLVSLTGRSSLKTLTAVESDGVGHRLAGVGLYSGFYVNELLVRLLGEGEAESALFGDYRWIMQALSSLEPDRSPEPLLRQFEWRLLALLGYEVSFRQAADSGEAIQPEGLYRFEPEAGFIRTPASREPAQAARLFVGADLLACARADFADPKVRAAAKRLNRLMLQPLLGDRPLRSRAFFRSPS